MKFADLSPMQKSIYRFLVPASSRCVKQHNLCNVVLGVMIVWNIVYFTQLISVSGRVVYHVGFLSVNTIWAISIVAYACFVLYMDLNYGWFRYPPKDNYR